ncbi:MAG: hypothetical protein KAS23_15575, partial [Anaerohalosphaera sp.]|nr:hypothetical protein [Anaerohalosphaera sp.]
MLTHVVQAILLDLNICDRFTSLVHADGVTMTQAQDCIAIVKFTWDGQCQFINASQLENDISRSRVQFLKSLFNRTCKTIRKFSLDMYYVLAGKTMRLRFADHCQPLIYLAPHELVLDKSLLDFSSENREQRMDYMVGLLQGGLFHLCNPDFHITRVKHQSIYFYNEHSSICSATIKELEPKRSDNQSALLLEVLSSRDRIIPIETF